MAGGYHVHTSLSDSAWKNATQLLKTPLIYIVIYLHGCLHTSLVFTPRASITSTFPFPLCVVGHLSAQKHDCLSVCLCCIRIFQLASMFRRQCECGVTWDNQKVFCFFSERKKIKQHPRLTLQALKRFRGKGKASSSPRTLRLSQPPALILDLSVKNTHGRSQVSPSGLLTSKSRWQNIKRQGRLGEGGRR